MLQNRMKKGITRLLDVMSGFLDYIKANNVETQFNEEYARLVTFLEKVEEEDFQTANMYVCEFVNKVYDYVRDTKTNLQRLQILE
jgi:hypothetical protein